MQKTIATIVDPATLPKWAQAEPAVVALAAYDLPFRCDVCATQTAAGQKLQVTIAKRRTAECAAYLAGLTDPRD